MKTNLKSENLPLSKTVVVNYKKWGPPTTETQENNLVGTNLPFRRQARTPIIRKKLDDRLFTCARFSVFQEFNTDGTCYYVIQFVNHRVVCPTYKWLKDYLSDIFIGTISENLYHFPFGKYLWNHNVLHRFPQKKLR